MIGERDPEDIGPETYEETEFRMDVRQSVHTFDPDPETGKCQGHYIRHGMQGALCNSTQRYSVMHEDDRTWCCSLSEQGIDCGHGEGDYEEAMSGLHEALVTYIAVIEITTTVDPRTETDGDWRAGNVLQGADSFKVITVAKK